MRGYCIERKNAATRIGNYKQHVEKFQHRVEKLCSDGVVVSESFNLKLRNKIGATLTNVNVISALKAEKSRKRTRISKDRTFMAVREASIEYREAPNLFYIRALEYYITEVSKKEDIELQMLKTIAKLFNCKRKRLFLSAKLLLNFDFNIDQVYRSIRCTIKFLLV